MYRLSLIVTAVGLLLAGSASAGLQGKDWGYPGLCQFSTYESCAATAAGTFSYCGLNPHFAFALQRFRYGQPAY